MILGTELVWTQEKVVSDGGPRAGRGGFGKDCAGPNLPPNGSSGTAFRWSGLALWNALSVPRRFQEHLLLLPRALDASSSLAASSCLLAALTTTGTGLTRIGRLSVC